MVKINLYKLLANKSLHFDVEETSTESFQHQILKLRRKLPFLQSIYFFNA